MQLIKCTKAEWNQNAFEVYRRWPYWDGEPVNGHPSYWTPCPACGDDFQIVVGDKYAQSGPVQAMTIDPIPQCPKPKCRGAIMMQHGEIRILDRPKGVVETTGTIADQAATKVKELLARRG